LYDAIIVGAGPAGLYSAYEFALKAPHLKILLIDKGHDIEKRKCPILEGKLTKCPPNPKGYLGCYPACSITAGFGGSGAYSDGKFNITNQFGGWLTEYLSDADVLALIEYVDEINLAHGATTEITDPTTKEVQAIEKKANAVNLKLLKAKLRHLGTEQNLIVMTNINKWLKKRLEMRFKTEMVDVIIEANEVKGIVLKNGEKLYSKNIILALGREGATSLVKLCQKHDLKMTNNQVDIGVRVETSNAVMKEINTHLYEGKFVYKTSLNTEVRTFCSNPSGHVVIENHNGTAVVNGHAFRDPKLGTDNTNFALLVSHRFTAPFNEPNEFAHAVANLANKLAVGGVIVQRYGDFINGKRTSKEGLEKNIIIPSLKEAIAGDLSLVLPYKTMQSLIEMMTVLDKITPGIASAETLFYGVEAKFYSARPEIDNNFETKIKGLYMAGDGAGLTRGLAQAGANGVFLAREIINKKEKD